MCEGGLGRARLPGRETRWGVGRGKRGKMSDKRPRGRGEGRKKGARLQRGRVGRRGDCTGCQVTRVRGEGRRALGGQRAQDARAPPGTRSPCSQPSPPRVPLGPTSRVAPRAACRDGRGGVKQGPKNSVPHTALHTWHPGLAICSQLTAFRARAGGLERCKDSAWGEDDFESTEAMNSVSQCLWCPYCVPSVPSSCWAQERTICSVAFVVHCIIL